MTRSGRFALVVGFILASAGGAFAEVFGTFSWQMQPYCNRVTLTLTSTPAGFTVDGADDLCGAGNRAGAVGIASFDPNGTVAVNVTIVTAPTGRAVHVSAIVDPATGNGTWTDSVGNAGTFAFGAHTPNLPPRPFPSSALPPGVITTVELAPGAVVGATVADGSLSIADFADPPLATFQSGNQDIELSNVPTVVRSVTLTAPATGRVLVQASGYVYFRDTSSAFEVARCSITTGTTVDGNRLIYMNDGGATGDFASDAFGAVRGYNVVAGPFTVNLVCDEYLGNAFVADTSMTALFIPH